MFDLRIGSPTAPEVAIECVGAVDPARIEAWKLGPEHGSIELDVRGDWVVVLKPEASVRDFRSQIESLLQVCEREGIRNCHVDWRLRRSHPALFDAFAALKIDSAHCYRPDGAGEVDSTLTGFGGWVDTQGAAFPGWITQFLTAPEQADVLEKLRRSGAPECHVFVQVGFGGAPWPVESYLGREIEATPTDPPELPLPLRAVWVTYGPNGLRWDGRTWHLFSAIVEGR